MQAVVRPAWGLACCAELLPAFPFDLLGLSQTPNPQPRLQVKGMGEKQIEVDRRLLKGRMARLRKDIEEVGGWVGRARCALGPCCR